MNNQRLAANLQGAESCLFLCSGNMIRSAFAELYAQHRKWAMPVRSAGTTYSNSGIHPRAAKALVELGVNEGKIRAFRPQLIGDLAVAPGPSELVFGMTNKHLSMAAQQGANGPGFLLTEALSMEHEIKDPYFEGGYEGVFREIAACIDALILGPDSPK